jgi:hypothetical protein
MTSVTDAETAMEKMRNAYIILFGKSGEKKSLGRYKRS